MGFFGNFSFRARSKNPRGLGIFENLGIFIPGDWEFLEIWGFMPNFGDICEIYAIVIPGIFWGWGFFGDGDLFSWDGDMKIPDIPPKSY